MTDEKYQEMMAKLHQAGKITSGAGDMPAPQDELMRRIEAAKSADLIKPVPYLEIKDPRKSSWRAMGQEQFSGPFKEYAESSAQVDKNTKELMALGVPYEKLQPFVMRRNEEKSAVHNLNRPNQPDPLGEGLISYNEERALGLDPSKYTQKPWNAGDYVGPMKSVVDELRQSQGSVLGPEAKELTPEEQAEFNRMKLKKLMGE